jgi:nicotinic acid phosphoribosyltransferase
MAHSYVGAFGSEDRAFTAFAGDFPAKATFLVNTRPVTDERVNLAEELLRGQPASVWEPHHPGSWNRQLWCLP